LFTLERSKDHNKAAAVTTKPLRSNATQSVDMLHWAYNKTNWKWNFAPLRLCINEPLVESWSTKCTKILLLAFSLDFIVFVLPPRWPNG